MMTIDDDDDIYCIAYCDAPLRFADNEENDCFTLILLSDIYELFVYHRLE